MTWHGELYLELHNGTFTSMAEHKLYNRFVETLLRDLEIFHSLSEILYKQDHNLLLSHDDIKSLWYTFLID